WRTVLANITRVTGTHTVYLEFSSGASGSPPYVSFHCFISRFPDLCRGPGRNPRRHGPRHPGGAMLVAFSVTPLGVGEAVGEYVADAVRVVRESGLPNRTDAMFTTIEGDWDEVMAVVRQAVDAVAVHAPRVSVVLKADIRPGATGALTAKMESLERHLAG